MTLPFDDSVLASRPSLYVRYVKPVADWLVVAAMLPILLPILILIAICVRMSGPGPVFLRVKCRGLGGRVFWQWRFRCLRLDALGRPQAGEAGQDPDARLTPVGRILLRSQLNLLPQVFNILCGDMALVGPTAVPLRHEPAPSGARQLVLQLRPGVIAPDHLADPQMPGEAFDSTAIALAYCGQATLGTDLKILGLACVRLLQPPRPHPVQGQGRG